MAKLTRANETEIATAGVASDITRTYLDELLIPQDRVLHTQGRGRGLEIYEQVLTDDQVHACLQQRFGAVTSTDWEVKAGGDRRIDRKAADFIRDQLNSLLWDDITEKMLYGVFYGYSVAECIWSRDPAGRVIFDPLKGGIRVRHRRRFRFGRDMQPRLITQTSYAKGIALPERKFWTFSAGGDNSDDPHGTGLGHWLYWPAWFKRHDIKFWLQFLEKFGMPTVLAQYDEGTPKAKQDILLQAAAAVSSRSAVKIPKGMMLSLLEASRGGTADYEAMYERMDGAIAKVCLSQTMTTDDGASLSQAQVHQSVANHVIKSDADLLNQSFNRGPVAWLTDWNFPGAAYPQVWRLTEPTQDLKAQAERDRVLFDMGFVPSPEYVQATYGDGFSPPASEARGLNGPQIASVVEIARQVSAGELPINSGRELVKLAAPGIDDAAAARILPDNMVRTAPTEPPPEPTAAPPIAAPEFSELTADTVDLYTERLRSQAGPIVAGWVERMRELLGEVDGLAEFSEKLATLYPDLPGDEFRAIMSQALTASSLAGAAEDTGEIDD